MPTFSEIMVTLTPEAKDLLVQMVNAHVASSANVREFIQTRTSAGTLLIFTDSDFFKRQVVDSTALNDLASSQAIRLVRGGRSPAFDIGPNARTLYSLIMNERGGASATVEEPVRRFIQTAALDSGHAGVAHHLSEAIELLMSDRTTDQVVSELGTHLRSALADLAGGLAGSGANPEKVADSLETWLASKAQPRAGEALTAMAATVLKLTQRLAHIRDETAKGRPLEGWHELRRATMLTATLCYELAEVDAGR